MLRFLPLCIVSLAVLMTVLDTTVVTVTLSAIFENLHARSALMSWALNAYTLSFGGFLLLSGRLGDLFGRKRLFMCGIAIFSVASLMCGLAHDVMTFLLARAAQGLGSAALTAVGLALIMELYPDDAQRATALGIYGLICAAGDGIGELVGGFVASTLGWHWIFLINVPIGVALTGFCAFVLPPDIRNSARARLDFAGAFTVTVALTLLVYVLVDSSDESHISLMTGCLTTVALLLLMAFIYVELRQKDPLVPLRLFRLRSFAAANIIGALWAAGAFAWFVTCALYLQKILGYSPFWVGMSYLPSTIITAICSIRFAPKVVTRFGTRAPVWFGLLLVAASLLLFGSLPLQGSFVVDVLPGTLLFGVGGGLSSAPLLIACMHDVKSSDTGIASGVVNTSFMLGGALGLAVLAGLAALRTGELQRSGVDLLTATNQGYHATFIAGGLLVALAALLGALLLRQPSQSPVSEPLAEAQGTVTRQL